MSCAPAGGGIYTDRTGHRQTFVVSQVNGTWGTAVEVPGIAALNTGGVAGIESFTEAGISSPLYSRNRV